MQHFQEVAAFVMLVPFTFIFAVLALAPAFMDYDTIRRACQY